MKRFVSSLFYLGLAISTIGFFGDKAEKFPLVLRMVAPSYTRASKGLETLEARTYLVPSDEGFAELAEIFWDETNSRKHAESLNGRLVLSFKRQAPFIGFDGVHAGEVIPVSVELSGGQNIKYLKAWPEKYWSQ